jgi:hypothetical protein
MERYAIRVPILKAIILSLLFWRLAVKFSEEVALQHPRHSSGVSHYWLVVQACLQSSCIFYSLYFVALDMLRPVPSFELLDIHDGDVAAKHNGMVMLRG